MNIKTIIVATTLLLSAGSTFAKVVDGLEEPPAFKSTLTRAQVQHDLGDALARGNYNESGYVPDTPKTFRSRSRNEVRAEAIASVKLDDTSELYTGS